MAIYELQMKKVSHSDGGNAIAAAAYRSGTALVDRENPDGVIRHDYTRKGGVMHSEIVLPQGVPAVGRNDLWAMAEAADTRKNSVTARELVLALPHELDLRQNLEILHDMARWLVTRYGVAVDFNVHEASRGHGPGTAGDPRNVHCHLMMTTREMTPTGLGKKTRVLDDRKTGPGEITLIRGVWEDFVNMGLKRAGLDVQVDSRSRAEQGLNGPAMLHLGRAATMAERRGEKTLSGDYNHRIETSRQLDAEIQEVEAEIAGLDKAMAESKAESVEEADDTGFKPE